MKDFEYSICKYIATYVTPHWFKKDIKKIMPPYIEPNQRSHSKINLYFLSPSISI